VPVLSLIERNFAALRGSSVLEDAFEEWRSNNRDALVGFEDVEDIISFCRASEPNLYAHKNEVLAVLCREALRGDDSAGLLLIWLFMPALWRIAEDLFREGCPLEREEIDAEILRPEEALVLPEEAGKSPAVAGVRGSTFEPSVSSLGVYASDLGKSLDAGLSRGHGPAKAFVRRLVLSQTGR
jgi:hypothetical protein